MNVLFAVLDSGSAFDSGYDAGVAARPYVLAALVVFVLIGVVWLIRRPR